MTSFCNGIIDVPEDDIVNFIINGATMMQLDGGISGSQNLSIGRSAGLNLTTGVNNVLIGNASGANQGSGNSNVFIGYNTGAAIVRGDNNILIGANVDTAPPSTIAPFNRLAIGAGASNLIAGEFNTGNVALCMNGIRGPDTYSSGTSILFLDHALTSPTSGPLVGGVPRGGYLYGKSGDSHLYWRAKNGTEVNFNTSFNGSIPLNNLTNCTAVGVTGQAINISVINANVFVGSNNGGNNTGTSNIFIGLNIGSFSTTASGNTAMGNGTLSSLTNGSNNTCIGFSSGSNLNGGDNNVCLGNNTRTSGPESDNELSIGVTATRNLITGQFNTGNIGLCMRAAISRPSNYGGTTEGQGVLFLDDATTNPVGIPNGGLGGVLYVNGIDLEYLDSGGIVRRLSGTTVSIGTDNLFLGIISGNTSMTGSNNTILGTQAGFFMTSGNNNMLIGRTAGSNLTSGSSNICIGYNSQATAPTTNNSLNIGSILAPIRSYKIGPHLEIVTPVRVIPQDGDTAMFTFTLPLAFNTAALHIIMSFSGNNGVDRTSSAITTNSLTAVRRGNGGAGNQINSNTVEVSQETSGIGGGGGNFGPAPSTTNDDTTFVVTWSINPNGGGTFTSNCSTVMKITNLSTTNITINIL